MPPTNEEEMTLPPQQTVNNVWGASTLGQRTFLTMPSGQTCWAKVVGLQGVLETGVMGEADSLSAFVGKNYIRKVRGAKGKADGEAIDAASLMKSPETLKKIVKMVDGLVPYVVVEPSVRCHYETIQGEDGTTDTRMIPPEDRESGYIYTDQIGLEDKMFLFNFAMSGVQDAESFREGSSRAVGHLADGEEVLDSAERLGGNRADRRQRPKRRRRT